MTMETKTIEVEESLKRRRGDRGNRKERDENQPPRLVKRAKLLISLKRSKDFAENMKKFNAIKEENEKFIEAERASKEESKQTDDAE